MRKVTLRQGPITAIIHGAEALSDALDAQGQKAPALSMAIDRAALELSLASTQPSEARSASLIATGMQLATAALDATAAGWSDASTDTEALLLAYRVAGDVLHATDEEPVTVARTLARAPYGPEELFSRAATLVGLIALAAEKTS